MDNEKSIENFELALPRLCKDKDHKWCEYAFQHCDDDAEHRVLACRYCGLLRAVPKTNKFGKDK